LSVAAAWREWFGQGCAIVAKSTTNPQYNKIFFALEFTALAAPLSTGKCKISDLFEESILWGLKI
jgi:hypothetical protein